MTNEENFRETFGSIQSQRVAPWIFNHGLKSVESDCKSKKLELSQIGAT